MQPWKVQRPDKGDCLNGPQSDPPFSRTNMEGRDEGSKFSRLQATNTTYNV